MHNPPEILVRVYCIIMSGGIAEDPAVSEISCPRDLLDPAFVVGFDQDFIAVFFRLSDLIRLIHHREIFNSCRDRMFFGKYMLTHRFLLMVLKLLLTAHFYT